MITWNIIVRNNISFLFRSNHFSCSIQKSILKNYAKLTGKQLCLSLFSQDLFSDILGTRIWKNVIKTLFRISLINSGWFITVTSLKLKLARVYSKGVSLGNWNLNLCSFYIIIIIIVVVIVIIIITFTLFEIGKFTRAPARNL